jgi:hypothetical protein
MAFVHGKSAQVLHNEYDLSAYFNDLSASRSVETAETTAFGSSAKTYIVGLSDGTISLSGMFDGAAGAVDAEMTDILGSNSGAVITISTAASLALGTRVISATGKLTSYEVSAPVGDVVAANAEFQADSGLGNGISLHALSAETATGTSSSHDNSASTANGGFGTLHVTANTMNNNTVFKVQHSSDGSTWADLVTFTTVATTVVTAERVTVAAGTTVNRYLRSSWTASGAGSITFHINFARR